MFKENVINLGNEKGNIQEPILSELQKVKDQFCLDTYEKIYEYLLAEFNNEEDIKTATYLLDIIMAYCIFCYKETAENIPRCLLFDMQKRKEEDTERLLFLMAIELKLSNNKEWSKKADALLNTCCGVTDDGIKKEHYEKIMQQILKRMHQKDNAGLIFFNYLPLKLTESEKMQEFNKIVVKRERQLRAKKYAGYVTTAGVLYSILVLGIIIGGFMQKHMEIYSFPLIVFILIVIEFAILMVSSVLSHITRKFKD